MTAGSPAIAVAQITCVINVANKQASTRAGQPSLGMATQAEILVPNGQQLCINGTVGCVANGASLAQRGMFENKRPGLLPMTLRAGLVQARHGQASRGFHDVQSVRIMALRAVHLTFEDGMMLRKMKLGIDVQVALKTCLRIFPGVNDEFLPPGAANGHMLASGPVAGFASARAGHCCAIPVKPGMRTCWKGPRYVCMAISASLIPHKGRTLNYWRCNDCTLDRYTRSDQESCPA